MRSARELLAEMIRLADELALVLGEEVYVEPPVKPKTRLGEVVARAVMEAIGGEGRGKVGYLGPEGSFCHEAARELFPEARLEALGSISELVAMVEEGSLDYAVIPIENSIEGPVNEAIDALVEHDVMIWAEHEHPIRLVLACNPDLEDPSRAEAMYSHPHALKQAYRSLARLAPRAEKVQVASTSLAARKASEDPRGCAVCSEEAARIHGLKVVAKGIEDEKHNYTRFLVVHDHDRPRGAAKTSIAFSVQHRPGALYEALKPLAEASVNLTMIYSRPLRGRPWHYVFYLDMEGSRKDPTLKEALERLREKCLFYKMLGSYPSVNLHR